MPDWCGIIFLYIYINFNLFSEVYNKHIKCILMFTSGKKKKSGFRQNVRVCIKVLIKAESYGSPSLTGSIHN